MGRPGMEQQEGPEGTAAADPGPDALPQAAGLEASHTEWGSGEELQGGKGRACGGRHATGRARRTCCWTRPDALPQAAGASHTEKGEEGAGARARGHPGRGGAGRGATHAWRRRGGRAPPPPGTCRRARAGGVSTSSSSGGGDAGGLGWARTRAGGRSRPGRPPPGRRPGAPPRPPSPGRPWCPRARPPARSSSSPFFPPIGLGIPVCLSVWRVEQCNPGEGAGVEVLLGAKGRVLGSPGAVVVSCFAVHPHSSTPRESFPSEERFTSEEQGAHLHRALEPSR